MIVNDAAKPKARYSRPLMVEIQPALGAPFCPTLGILRSDLVGPSREHFLSTRCQRATVFTSFVTGLNEPSA